MPTATSYTNKLRYLAIAKDVKVQLPGGVSNTFRPGLSDMCSDFKTTSPEITATTGGIITTFAGNGMTSVTGDGGLAVNAGLFAPTSVIADLDGNIFYIDTNLIENTSTIRKINGNGIITNTGVTTSVGVEPFKSLTISENVIYCSTRVAIFMLVQDGSGYRADIVYTVPTGILLSYIAFVSTTPSTTFLASTSTDMSIYRITLQYYDDVDEVLYSTTTVPFRGLGPLSVGSDDKPITLDSDGYLYVASSRYSGVGVFRRQFYSVTRFSSDGSTLETDCGDISRPTFFSNPAICLTGIAIGPDGSVYVSDALLSLIIRIDKDTRNITTFAGGGPLPLFSGDGSLAIQSNLNTPSGIVFDTKSNLLICDTNNHRIRKVTPSVTTTIPGKTTYNPPWFAPVEYREICNCKINAPIAAETLIEIYDGL